MPLNSKLSRAQGTAVSRLVRRGPRTGASNRHSVAKKTMDPIVRGTKKIQMYSLLGARVVGIPGPAGARQVEIIKIVTLVLGFVHQIA